MLAAYGGLFAWSFAAATVLPLSSDVAFGYMVHLERSMVLPIAAATIGNTLGSCATYWMARGVRRAAAAKVSPKQPSPRRLKALALTRRWGAVALLLSWVPVFGDALVLAAGALRMPFPRALCALLVGKLARYLVVGWAVLEMSS